ncbi:MAG: N-ethylammeline chlorohydrolase [Verrucomicrobiaceae bacterium]|nr:N-ethylammeline chlorohydrolase [Verrucomicrobiaceae bacterium]
MQTHAFPTTADTVIFARWIVPLAAAPLTASDDTANQDALEHHALVISEGRIAAILPAAQAASIAAEQVFHLTDHALMPGLVNAHGHAAMSLLRGYADDFPLHSWLNEHIWPAEGKWVSEDFVRDGTQLAIAEMLRSGTTCFADMYFFPNIVAQTAQELSMRAQMYFPIFDFPTAWGQNPDDYIHKGLLLRDDFKHSELISVGFGPHAPYTVGDTALRRVAVLAEELDAAIQIHVHETQQEVDDAIAEYGDRPLARLQRLGLLGPRTTCVHATALNADDIALLARNNCHVVHCPESNLKLASGFCPVQLLIDANVNVALGSDGAASNNDLDLFAELRTAALLTKAIAKNAAALPARAALEMATLNGAKALGLDEHIGSLEIGKLADVIAVDMSSIETQPLFNPLSQLVYTNSGSRVTHSWIGGKLMLENRLPTAINLQDLSARARDWQHKISLNK